MKRKLFSIILSMMLSLNLGAQQSWNLQQCISYALQHATEVRRQQINEQQKRADYKVALLDFLPSVSAQVSGQYSWGRNIDPETNTYNNVTTFNNYYELGASLTLFDGGATINAFRKAKLDRRNGTSMMKAKDETAISVMEKFVDAVYAQRAIAIAEEKLRDSKALLDKTRRQYELGEKSRPDVVQIESQMTQDDYDLLHQRNVAASAMADLKTAMNYPMSDTLALDWQESQTILPSERSGRAAEGTPMADKPAVEQAKIDAEKARLEWKIERASLWPTLTLGAAVATNYYRNITAGGSTEGFGSQFHNNMGEYVFVTLSIPIFSPQRWGNARQAKTQWQLARLNLEDARRKQYDDAFKALMDYQGYLKEMSQLKQKVASDSLAYHLSTRKYEEGMLSTFDLHTAAQTLLESRVKLLQTQMLLALKAKLVAYYYDNQPLWSE